MQPKHDGGETHLGSAKPKPQPNARGEVIEPSQLKLAPKATRVNCIYHHLCTQMWEGCKWSWPCLAIKWGEGARAGTWCKLAHTRNEPGHGMHTSRQLGE